MNKKIFLLTILCFLTVLFCGCGRKYTIAYDANGGIMPQEYLTEFRVKDNYVLPIPQKEGFIFLGWTENEIIIDVLKNKDYNLTAKWIEVVDYSFIDDNQIFNQEQEEYLVYFMKTGCPWCDKIKDDVIRYQLKTNQLEQYNSNIKLYAINLYSNGKKSIILRKYTENNEEEGFFVSDAKKWDDLYIPSTPALIKISTEENIRKAEVLETGATSIKNKLFEYIKDEKDYSKILKPYEIKFNLNGGNFENEINYTFYTANSYVLPIPKLEGFTFVGWYEGDIKINQENLENKNYNLDAKWEKTIATLTIKKEEIFHKNGDYYVLFLKNIHNISDFIDIVNQYNTIATLNGNKLIYVIDMNDCEEIYRTYSEENKNYINEATEWNEFYISERYTLIEMNDELSLKKAQFITSSKQNVLKFLNGKNDFLTK